ncbi:MAG: DnaJ domain-containing protein [Tagaea sp.]|nr:DnaJ domain-containing protein [Tagaea sp.]
MPRSRTRPYDRPQVDPHAPPRGCDRPGCVAHGEYRAPKGRERLGEYFWFCLDHVREYNAAWDFYKGADAATLEREKRADTIGRRPTWPLGLGMGGAKRAAEMNQEEMEEALRRWFKSGDIPGFGAGRARARAESALRKRVPAAVEEALSVLDLDVNAGPAEIKSRYKELVKRHHPDANGGDKAAEERLKSINQAYTILKAQGAKPAAGL